MNKTRNIGNYMPFIALGILFLVFGIASKGAIFQPFNLRSLVEQIVPITIGGLGVIFVAATGSVDLSVGSLMGLAAVIASMLGEAFGTWIIIPAALLVGAGVGLLNGFIVSKCKVSSFMTTLAMLFALKGMTNFFLDISGLIQTPKAIKALNATPVKMTILVAAIVIMYYVFEKTKYGRCCKVIGENELTVITVGIPVQKYRMIAYVLSGFMAGGVGAVLSLAKLGGPTNTMGAFQEIRIMLAIFLGGVMVTGGMSTKIYKLIVGAFSIIVIENGLILAKAPTEFSEMIQGICLILIVFLISYFNKRSVRMSSMKPENEK